MIPTRIRIVSSVFLGLVLAAGSAQADIYAFTDSDGVTHFSNVPNDDRYALILAAPVAEETERDNTQAQKWLARSAEYDSMIERAARETTVQSALLRAVIMVESGFNPRAVSKRGAIGLMQLVPATARRYGVADAYDPEENIGAGARYLGDLIKRFDSNIELALAAYNAGEVAVERAGRQVPPFQETRRYVPDVLRVYHALLVQNETT